MSKADWLLKTLACMQAAWVAVRTVVRINKGQPVSALEVTTCSYVMCALTTYVFWWKKPYGVQTHINLDVHTTRGPDWEQNTNPTPFNRNFTFGNNTITHDQRKYSYSLGYQKY